MVPTRSMVNERMPDAEQMTLLMSLQREMAKMNNKNEEKILTLRKKKEEMRKKLAVRASSDGPNNVVEKSFMTPFEPKPSHTQEAEDESYLNKSFPTLGTLDIFWRHPFTNYVWGQNCHSCGRA